MAANTGTGARMQLMAIGPQDKYVLDASDSGIFFFKTQFKRATRFATDTATIAPNPDARWGSSTTVPIPIAADVLGGVFLEVRLPVLPHAHPDDRWARNLGYLVVRRCKVMWRDLLVFDEERLWTFVKDALFSSCPKEKRDAMMGNGGTLKTSETHVIHIPIPGPWSASSASSPSNSSRWFPLVTMPNTVFTLSLDLEDLPTCVSLASRSSETATYASPLTLNVTSVPGTLAMDDGTFVTVGHAGTVRLPRPWSAVAYRGVSIVTSETFVPTPETMDTKVHFEVAYLDDDERRLMARVPVPVFVDAAQDTEVRIAPEDTGTARLDFSEVNASVRALVWMAYPELPSTAFDFVTSRLLEEATISLNHTDLIEPRPTPYFSLVGSSPHRYLANVCVHAFAIDPAPFSQPSGSVDFSRAKRPSVVARLRDDRPTDQVFLLKGFAMTRRLLVAHNSQLTIAR